MVDFLSSEMEIEETLPAGFSPMESSMPDLNLPPS